MDELPEGTPILEPRADLSTGLGGIALGIQPVFLRIKRRRKTAKW